MDGCSPAVDPALNGQSRKGHLLASMEWQNKMIYLDTSTSILQGLNTQGSKGYEHHRTSNIHAYQAADFALFPLRFCMNFSINSAVPGSMIIFPSASFLLFKASAFSASFRARS